MESTPIYSLRVADVYRSLETSPAGLSTDEVEARRSLYGNNLLAEPPKRAAWPIFVSHLHHGMARILWTAAAISFLAGDFVLGSVICMLVLANAVFSFWREYRAEQAMQALHQLLPAYARLIRNNKEVLVPACEVVPGDILVLAEGDNIPADARVVEEYGLRTNNSTITGESVPARKTAEASIREGTSELERPNLVFAGTSIVSGTGKAVVYATGMLTQFGRIAHLTQTVKEEPSHLQREMARMTHLLSYMALGLSAIVLIVGQLDPTVGIQGLPAFFLALGILVAFMPEGLPATLTLSLAMAVQRLAQHGVLVKKLAIVDTMGNISVICTDKSGTLTQNQMTVRDIWVARQRLAVSGVGYEPTGEFTSSRNDKPVEGDLLALLDAAALCNNSRLNPPTQEHPHWSCLGDQTEAALRVAAAKLNVREDQLGALYPRIHELPFDARRKRMSTIHRDQQKEIAFVKGAPREVLLLCTHILIDGEEHPLDQELRAEILAANDDYARNALRVLALARRELPQRSGSYTVEKVERDLTFLGLMAMMDPPRPEVAQAVQTCCQAGIRMVMITGDYGLTAESLARRVGMLSGPNPMILTGAELDALNDAEIQGLLDNEIIFARMAPEHKLRLVAAFQERGEVVAVTGDGVNDAPALRKADVGIAMGIVGTDVAKEAADVIITNDNFAAIVSAIGEGRGVYDNIRKFITYIFSSNVPEILPFTLTAMFKIPLALTVRQILAIDLGTDLLPGLALGTEKPEPNVMHRPPRRRNQPLLDRGLIVRAFCLGLLEATLCYIGFFIVRYGLPSIGMLRQITLPWFDVSLNMNLTSEQISWLAVTVFHAGVVTAQAGNAFACRSETDTGRHLGWFSNPFLLAGVGAEILIILMLIYAPPLAQAFNHIPLPPVYWLILFSYSIIVYSLDWIIKSIVRHFRHTNGLAHTSVIRKQEGGVKL